MVLSGHRLVVIMGDAWLSRDDLTSSMFPSRAYRGVGTATVKVTTTAAPLDVE